MDFPGIHIFCIANLKLLLIKRENGGLKKWNLTYVSFPGTRQWFCVCDGETRETHLKVVFRQKELERCCDFKLIPQPSSACWMEGRGSLHGFFKGKCSMISSLWNQLVIFPHTTVCGPWIERPRTTRGHFCHCLSVSTPASGTSITSLWPWSVQSHLLLFLFSFFNLVAVYNFFSFMIVNYLRKYQFSLCHPLAVNLGIHTHLLL